MHLKSLKKHFKKLMHLKRLESFLMNVEVIFYVKKQMKLEKNSIKRKSFIIF